MKQLQIAKARFLPFGATMRWSSAGPAMVISRKPKPSNARPSSSAPMPWAVAPVAPPKAIASSPVSSMRLSPARAIHAPTGIAPTTPSTENIAISQPIIVRSRPKSARSWGTAIATLPTCNEATTPAVTTMPTASHGVAAGRCRAAMDRGEGTSEGCVMSRPRSERGNDESGQKTAPPGEVDGGRCHVHSLTQAVQTR
jgi:hypothetical protein